MMMMMMMMMMMTMLIMLMWVVAAHPVDYCFLQRHRLLEVSQAATLVQCLHWNFDPAAARGRPWLAVACKEGETLRRQSK